MDFGISTLNYNWILFYRCQLTDKFLIFLFLVEPNIKATQGGTEDVKMSDYYKLTCIATGTPTPDVRWTRNGEKDPREQVRILLVTKRVISRLH